MSSGFLPCSFDFNFVFVFFYLPLYFIICCYMLLFTVVFFYFYFACTDLTSIRNVRDIQTCLSVHVFFLHVLQNTLVSFVLSVCGVTMSYRLIKPIHHFSPSRLSQQYSSWRIEPTQNVVWNNQHVLTFRFVLS